MEKITRKKSVGAKKVLVLLYNRFTNDSRVLKTCTSLANAGYQVELWASYGADLPEHEIVSGFKVWRKFGKPTVSLQSQPTSGNEVRDAQRKLAWVSVVRSFGSDAIASAGRIIRESLRMSAKHLKHRTPRFHDLLKNRYIVVARLLMRANKPARRPARHIVPTFRSAAIASAGRIIRESLRMSAKHLKHRTPRFHDLLKNRYIVVERLLMRANSPAKRPARRIVSTLNTQTEHLLSEGAFVEFDFIHCNDLLPLPLASAMKARAPGLKLIYDSHEYQIESAGLIGKPEKKLLFEKLESDNIGSADAVITVGDSIAGEYQRLYDLQKVHVVRNCPPLTPDRAENEYFREKYQLAPEDIIFLYQGGLMKNVRGLEETLRCFIRLSQAGFTRHFIVFMGFGNMAYQIQSAAQTHSNILFHPSISSERIPEVSSSADYGTIFAPNNCLSYFYSLPNKLFEYIVCGLPIVTTPLYDMQNLIQEEGIGHTTADFTEDAIYKTLSQIDTRPTPELRARIRALHRDKYNWGIEEKTLLEVYRNA